MGNANGREDGIVGSDGAVNGGSNVNSGNGVRAAPGRVPSDSMAHSPPSSPSRSRSPILFSPQVSVAPLQRGNGPLNTHISHNEVHSMVDHPLERGIPTLITWAFGGNSVSVEGSWDRWTSRKILQRTGKGHSILMVLPSGIYHYKFIVDGGRRYNPDLPFVADEMGHICNMLDVNDFVPENPESISEFEPPASPESTYTQEFPTEEDFAKDPLAVPSQLHRTVLGMDKSDEASSSKPQHVVLNHLFIEKGLASQSAVALGLTHRFESKYVTVVLYKPLKR